MIIKIENTGSQEIYDSLVELEALPIHAPLSIRLLKRELRKSLIRLNPDLYMIYKSNKFTHYTVEPFHIRDVVYKYFNVTDEEINRKNKKREIVKVRMYVFVFARRYTKHSLATIGSLYKYGSNHATVLHAIKTINDLRDSELSTRKEIQGIELLLKENYPNLTVLNEVI